MKLFIQTCFIITLLLIFGGTVNAGSNGPAIGTIYVVDGAGSGSEDLPDADSNLYILDPSDCSVQLVGDIGFSHVTGIAIHPTTQVMYGVSNPSLPRRARLVVENMPHCKTMGTDLFNSR